MRKESCGAEPEKGIPRSQYSELKKSSFVIPHAVNAILCNEFPIYNSQTKLLQREMTSAGANERGTMLRYTTARVVKGFVGGRTQ